jgi:LETM1 and EF-hand domain-containing protein 1
MLMQDEKQRKVLRVRIEMAKFLQETISESGLRAEKVVNSDEFKEFFRKVRSLSLSCRLVELVRAMLI